jgi:hypothetical protein
LRGKGTKYRWNNIIFALFLVTLIAGCGISTSAYLFSPLRFDVSNSQLSVQNDGANYEASEGSAQTFKGIDIFYKIFQDNARASVELTQLNDWTSIYYGNPEAFISRAKTNGFIPMRKDSTAMQPLIGLVATDESLHTIETSNWKLDGSVQVVRNITRSQNSFLEKNFADDDPDYNGANSIGGGTFYMVLFAVSYGEDTIGAPVYSDPFIALNILTF